MLAAAICVFNFPNNIDLRELLAKYKIILHESFLCITIPIQYYKNQSNHNPLYWDKKLFPNQN